MTAATTSSLDTAVLAARAALQDLGVPDPALLFLCGTGLPQWASATQPVAPAAFRKSGSLHLSEVPGIPGLWSNTLLHFGTITTPTGLVNCWLLDDVSLDAPLDPDAQPYERGFILWLAAQAGARLCLHTSAGGNLPGSQLAPGSLCLVRDYINLSGSSPLMGIGPSKLGPMFPDLTQLFSPALLHIAKQRAATLDLACAELVMAASAPVSMPTLAERTWFESAGAQAWAQGLAGPFLAAAHAGLEVLAIVVILDHSPSPSTNVEALLLASEAAAPRLDALLAELAIPLATAAQEARQ